MDLTFSDQQLTLRGEVAAFLTEERAAGSFTPHVDAWITGFDLAGVRTRAVRSGSGWRVTGHKVWTSLAQHADYIYVLARTDPASERHDGLLELIVPLRSEGITITPIHDMSGAHHFNEVFF